MPSKPVIKSFLIADSVIQEKGSNKWSAIGIFDRIYTHNFPFLHANTALYIKLADAEGEYELKIEFVDSSGRKLGIFEGIKLKVLSKLDTPDFGIKTQNLFIPASGKYHFDLYFNNQHCANIPLIVEEIKGAKWNI